MIAPNSQLYSLALEWARLRQRARTERDPGKLEPILLRLSAMLGEAEMLYLNHKTSSRGPAVRENTASGAKSGNSD